MEICQFCKKVCSGERGLSLHMYHSFECFQKLTDISKKYQNYTLIHTQRNDSLPIYQNLQKDQYPIHQNKKVKTSHNSDFNSISDTSNFDLEVNQAAKVLSKSLFKKSGVIYSSFIIKLISLVVKILPASLLKYLKI